MVEGRVGQPLSAVLYQALRVHLAHCEICQNHYVEEEPLLKIIQLFKVSIEDVRQQKQQCFAS